MAALPVFDGKDEYGRPEGNLVSNYQDIRSALDDLNLQCVVRTTDRSGYRWTGATAIDGQGNFYQLRQSHRVGCGMMGNHHGLVRIAKETIEGVRKMYPNGVITQVYAKDPTSPQKSWPHRFTIDEAIRLGVRGAKEFELGDEKFLLAQEPEWQVSR